MSEELEIKELSEEEVWSTIQFSQALYGGLSGLGWYNPFTTQSNLISANNNPLIPTYERIIDALSKGVYKSEELCGYSEFMEVFDSIYAKVLRYMKSLLAFDLSITCTNIKDPKEYQSDEYKQDLRRVYKFLDNFDYKQEFRDKIVPEILRRDTVFVTFRDSHEIDSPIDIDTDKTKIKKNEKFALQIMPQKHCKLTGYFNSSQLLYDFDMNYFLKPNVDINLFSPFYKRKWKEVTTTNKPYIPSTQLDKRNGIYAMWVQTSPLDGAYAFKMDVSNLRQIPPFANLMKSCFDNQTVEDLQKDKNLLSARAFIFGAMRMFDNAKSGTQKNQFAIDPKTLGNLMSLVAKALKDKVQPIAMPTEDNKMEFFEDKNPNMAVTQYKSTASQGISASSLIYTDGKMAQFEMQQAVETDYAFMSQLYEQFNNFMNFYVNKKTTKYKFDFNFDGCDRLFHRAEKRKALNELVTVGLTPNESYIASVYGIKPQAFSRMLEEAHYGGMIDKITLLANMNTSKDGGMVGGVNQSSNEVGNVVKDDIEVSDSGAEARDYE